MNIKEYILVAVALVLAAYVYFPLRESATLAAESQTIGKKKNRNPDLTGESWNYNETARRMRAAGDRTPPVAGTGFDSAFSSIDSAKASQMHMNRGYQSFNRSGFSKGAGRGRR